MFLILFRFLLHHFIREEQVLHLVHRNSNLTVISYIKLLWLKTAFQCRTLNPIISLFKTSIRDQDDGSSKVIEES